jgi:hypothetical protein
MRENNKMTGQKNTCLSCSGEMISIGTEKLQLGQTDLLLNMWRNILAGALEVEIFICSDCKKIEFYANDVAVHNSGNYGNLPQKSCQNCKKTHDIDYPKCPHCGYREE